MEIKEEPVVSIKKEDFIVTRCRCCLDEKIQMGLWTQFEDDGKQVNYGEMIEECFGFQWIDYNSDEQICSECIQKLQYACDLKSSIVKVNEILLNIKDGTRIVVKMENDNVERISVTQDEAEEESGSENEKAVVEASEEAKFEASDTELDDSAEYLEFEQLDDGFENLDEEVTDVVQVTMPSPNSWHKKIKVETVKTKSDTEDNSYASKDNKQALQNAESQSLKENLPWSLCKPTLKFYLPKPTSNSTQNCIRKTPNTFKTIQVVEESVMSLPPIHKGTVQTEEPTKLNNPLPLITETLNNIIDPTKDLLLPCETSTSNKSRRQKLGATKRAIAKKLRNTGLGYISAKSNIWVPAREMGAPCNDRCRFKCSEILTECQRKVVFDGYWNLGSLSKQREYIAKHLTEIKPKYQYKRVGSNRKPNHAFHFTVEGVKQRVCKVFFIRTLGVNDRTIRTVIRKLNSSGIVEPDLRGKHEKHIKIREELLVGVRRHINSIPRIKSRYLKKRATGKYIDGGKNVTNLYNDYKKNCKDNREDYVKISMYRKLFNQEMQNS